jgi:hypothetical protein
MLSARKDGAGMGTVNCLKILDSVEKCAIRGF